VDALRAEGATTSSLGLEILLRRLSGVQLADLALQSSKSGKWMNVPELKIPGKKK